MEYESFIHWGPSPEIFSFGFLRLRWYGLLFASGFLAGYYIMCWIYRSEGKREADVSQILTTTVVATLIGARLGHCLFYEPEFYLANPLKILKIWEGGLASHGGIAAVVIGLYFYSKKKADQPFLYVTDRALMATAVTCGFIRLGNLMNSEIIGTPTSVPWAFVFTRLKPELQVPRHPAQIYETLLYWGVFLLALLYYRKHQGRPPEGAMTGGILAFGFGARIFAELFKENQVAFEQGMALNMGQLLSIPILLFGAFLIVRAYKKSPS